MKSETYDSESEAGYACTLKFTYTPNYPEESPEVEIEDIEHFGDDVESRLRDHLLKESIHYKRAPFTSEHPL